MAHPHHDADSFITAAAYSKHAVAALGFTCIAVPDHARVASHLCSHVNGVFLDHSVSRAARRRRSARSARARLALCCRFLARSLSHTHIQPSHFKHTFRHCSCSHHTTAARLDRHTEALSCIHCSCFLPSVTTCHTQLWCACGV
jgi:hypothetical protein